MKASKRPVHSENTTLPEKLCQLLDGLTDGPLPSWYVRKENFVWGKLPEDDNTKRRKVLRGWLAALDRSRISGEWSTLRKKCTTMNPALASEIGSDPGVVLVLESMLYALRPLEIENAALRKKRLRDIRDAANKLKKALAIIQASGFALRVLAPGHALEPLVKDVAFIALESVNSLRDRDQAAAKTKREWKRRIIQEIADQVRPQPEMLAAWLDELAGNCGDWLEGRASGLRGKEPARRARALAECLARNIAMSLLGSERDWVLAAAFASAASGECVDSESLRITAVKRKQRATGAVVTKSRKTR